MGKSTSFIEGNFSFIKFNTEQSFHRCFIIFWHFLLFTVRANLIMVKILSNHTNQSVKLQRPLTCLMYCIVSQCAARTSSSSVTLFKAREAVSECNGPWADQQIETQTRVSAVCMGLVAVVPTVVIAITFPVIWDAAAAVTLELSAGAGVPASSFIAVVPAVVIWKTNAATATSHF